MEIHVPEGSGGGGPPALHIPTTNLTRLPCQYASETLLLRPDDLGEGRGGTPTALTVLCPGEIYDEVSSTPSFSLINEAINVSFC